MAEKTLSRRDFLKLAGATATGAVAAACGATPTPTPAPTETGLPSNRFFALGFEQQPGVITQERYDQKFQAKAIGSGFPPEVRKDQQGFFYSTGKEAEKWPGVRLFPARTTHKLGMSYLTLLVNMEFTGENLSSTFNPDEMIINVDGKEQRILGRQELSQWLKESGVFYFSQPGNPNPEKAWLNLFPAGKPIDQIGKIEVGFKSGSENKSIDFTLTRKP